MSVLDFIVSGALKRSLILPPAKQSNKEYILNHLVAAILLATLSGCSFAKTPDKDAATKEIKVVEVVNGRWKLLTFQ